MIVNASSLNSALYIVLQSEFFDPLFAWDVALGAGSTAVPLAHIPVGVPPPRAEKNRLSLKGIAQELRR